MVSGFGFRVYGFGFRVYGFGFRVSGFGFRVSGFGFRVSGVGFRVSGVGFRVGWGLTWKLDGRIWGTERACHVSECPRYEVVVHVVLPQKRGKVFIARMSSDHKLKRPERIRINGLDGNKFTENIHAKVQTSHAPFVPRRCFGTCLTQTLPGSLKTCACFKSVGQ